MNTNDEYIVLKEYDAWGISSNIATKFSQVMMYAKNLSWEDCAVLTCMLRGQPVTFDGLIINPRLFSTYRNETSEFIAKKITTLKKSGWITGYVDPVYGDTHYQFNLGMLHRLRLYNEMANRTANDYRGEWSWQLLDEILIPAQDDFHRKYRDEFARQFLEERGKEIVKERLYLPADECESNGENSIAPLDFPVLLETTLRDGSKYNLLIEEDHVNDYGAIDLDLVDFPGDLREWFNHANCKVKYDIVSMNLLHAGQLAQIARSRNKSA